MVRYLTAFEVDLLVCSSGHFIRVPMNLVLHDRDYQASVIRGFVPARSDATAAGRDE